ncbi:hypothetical protein SAMN04488569_102910 [Marinilactibacillus piezotolerans]|uniref:Zn-finger containing protein n=1 Tax=Marinilactibacillus piezotolerans TaxID=258723 RepID=A0A1I3Z593_9LACT|nr:hypothetical protein [Marinilactibacillus piezotolerans]SFK39147.1 hypothetical protein SAMN04488569_102910 [Marinilactibacillus piezotolerans]
MQFIQKMMFYMNGRYGMDELSKVLMVVGLITNILSSFFGGWFLQILGVAFIAYAVLRVLSKEKANRYKEFTRYIKLKQKIVSTIQRLRNKQAQHKVYKYYKCGACKQKVRVPRGRGKVRITCPSCQNQFVKKT